MKVAGLTLMAILIASFTMIFIPIHVEAQVLGKAECPAGQKKTTLVTFKDQGSKRLKIWCIGTEDPRNKTGSAYFATELVTTTGFKKTSVWIHKCGFDNGDNTTTDKSDIGKKITIENISSDGKTKVIYDYDVVTGKLTITTKLDGTVTDVKTLEGTTLPSGPQKIPHPGKDGKFGTSDDISLLDEGCHFDMDTDLAIVQSGLTLTPSIIDVADNNNVKIDLCASEEAITVLDATITDPLGSSFFDVFVDPFEIAEGDCFSWNTLLDFVDLSTINPGAYVVEIDTAETTITGEFSVPFFVIPESQIGIIALMASSLAALGGFILLRRRQGSTPSGSLSNLGI